MQKIDYAPAVRERAYFLWEKAGRPQGREHEFWAQASQEIESDQKAQEAAERENRIVAR